MCILLTPIVDSMTIILIPRVGYHFVFGMWGIHQHVVRLVGFAVLYLLNLCLLYTSVYPLQHIAGGYRHFTEAYGIFLQLYIAQVEALSLIHI